VNGNTIGQRVLNVFHHLEDGTLPPDLWDPAAELAAMVFLLKMHPEATAWAKYAHAVRRYTASNERIRRSMPEFDATLARRRMRELSLLIRSLPATMNAASIYRSLVITDAAAWREASP